jgi:hypothetical protein
VVNVVVVVTVAIYVVMIVVEMEEETDTAKGIVGTCHSSRTYSVMCGKSS